MKLEYVQVENITQYFSNSVNPEIRMPPRVSIVGRINGKRVHVPELELTETEEVMFINLCRVIEERLSK